MKSVSEERENSTRTEDLKFGVPLSDNAEAQSNESDADVGHYLSTSHRQLYPAVCEKSVFKALLSVVIINLSFIHSFALNFFSSCFSFSFL